MKTKAITIIDVNDSNKYFANSPMKPTSNADNMLPFQAVRFNNLAKLLQDQGREIISLGIGEPDFTAPQPVLDALVAAGREGKSGYSPTQGILPLRQKIAEFYATLSADVSPDQVVVATGASGALALICQAVLNVGDDVLLPEPYYPANYNFVIAAHANPIVFPTAQAHNFQPTLQDIKDQWTPNTRMVLLASPNNPAGTTISLETLRDISTFAKAQGAVLVLDEIYLPLSYDQKAVSGLTVDPDIIVINSFSKYFNMTGWRLGWLVAPPEYIEAIETVSASLTICPSTLAQHAALACFEPESLVIYEERREQFKARRDYLVPALRNLGFKVPVNPQGAFYIFADISEFGMDSFEFAVSLLEEEGVVVIPGIDFGPTVGKHMIRLSYATKLPQIKRALARIESFLKRRQGASV